MKNLFGVSEFGCAKFARVWSTFLHSKALAKNQMHCEITDHHFNIFFCWNTIKKIKLEKCFLGARVWVESFPEFGLHFYILSHLQIIRCIVKSLIATSTYFLSKYNWKNRGWKIFFGCQSWCPNWYTGLPNGLNMSLH